MNFVWNKINIIFSLILCPWQIFAAEEVKNDASIVNYDMYKKQEPDYTVQEGDCIIKYPGYSFVDLPDQHITYDDDIDQDATKDQLTQLSKEHRYRLRKMLYTGENDFQKDLVVSLEHIIPEFLEKIIVYKNNKVQKYYNRLEQKYNSMLKSFNACSFKKIKRLVSAYKDFLRCEELKYMQDHETEDQAFIEKVVRDFVHEYRHTEKIKFLINYSSLPAGFNFVDALKFVRLQVLEEKHITAIRDFFANELHNGLYEIENQIRFLEDKHFARFDYVSFAKSVKETWGQYHQRLELAMKYELERRWSASISEEQRKRRLEHWHMELDCMQKLYPDKNYSKLIDRVDFYRSE